MAKPRMDLSAFVGKLLEEQDGDVLREGIRVLSQALMETEVAGLIGAERHERTGERTAYRNGARMRTWDTRMGTIELAIPKVRPGTYFPSLLQPRRRAEHALLAGLQGAALEERVLRLWCAKEAAAKCLGIGLQGEPAQFVVAHADARCENLQVEHPLGSVEVRVVSRHDAVVAVATPAAEQPRMRGYAE